MRSLLIKTRLKNEVTMFELGAKTVTAERTEFCWLAGFADDPIDTTQYLILQRGLKGDEQDVRLRMNTYHIEINDQGAACYGGISSLRLEPTELALTFSPRGAADLGYAGARITFAISPEELTNLRDVLREMLAGSDVRVTGLG